MNNTLDFKRLGKVIKRDCASFISNLSLTLIILWAIPVIFWLFSSLTPGNDHIEAISRIGFIKTLQTIILILAPARIYKYCNDSRQGIGYAMLPASSLEKFISMVFYCVIVAPIVYLVGALAVDSILAIFAGPYDGFAISAYFDSQAQIKQFFETHPMSFDESWPLMFNSISPTFMILSSIFSTLMLSSIFMLGNMVFKKRKTGKTIGIIILICIIIMICFVNYVAHFETMFSSMDADNAAEIIKRMMHIMMNVVFYTSIVVSIVMLWLTYYKIKTQKY